LATLTQTAPAQFALTGDLDLDSVPALAREGRRLWADGAASVTVDLAGVERSSSAAVALLLEWTSQARRADARLHFLHWPDAMVRIAELCNLDGVLQPDRSTSEAARLG
jgi:phospholipid transport system transporter-binding protein